jgi:cAMP-dependent protein kinase regulator
VSTDRVNAVRRAPIFSELHPDDFRAFVNKLGRRVYRAGEVVIEEGTHGRAMFAIARGRVSVQRRRQSQNEEVAQMGEGEFFGEMALVANVPRLASVRALEECELLELTAANLDDLCSLAPQIRDVLVRFYKERLLENLLRSTEILRLMPRRSQHVLLDLLELRTAPAGVRLLEQGRDGAGIFVILRGQCQASHRDEKGSVTPYPLMQEGELFGELSHLQQAPVSADVTTLTPCVLLVLPPRFIDDVLLAEPDVRAKIYEVAGQRARRTRDLLSQLAVERGLI